MPFFYQVYDQITSIFHLLDNDNIKIEKIVIK
jgi:hypothetical protein